MRFGDIGTFIVLALLAPKIGALGDHLKASSAFALLSCAGTLLAGLVLIPAGVGNAVLMPIAIVTAIGGALLFCLWAQIYCRIGATQTIIYGSASCIAAAVVSFLISTVQQPYAIVFTSLLSIGSIACVWLSIRYAPAEPTFHAEVRFPVPWKLIAMMTLAGFLSSLAGILLQGGMGGAVHRIWATGLAGSVILIAVYLRRERCDVRFLAKVALPLAAAAYVILPFADSALMANVVSFLSKLAYVWFTFFVLLVLSNIARRYDVPSLRMFAIARACSEFAIMVGVIGKRSIIADNLHLSAPFLYGAMAVGVIMLLLCVIIWMSEKSVNADWGASGINVQTGVKIMSPHEQYLMRCESLGEHYGLTERETEVLALIGQRKSRAEIEQELFLSENTVKTHVRHVYQKLSVHSKADVYRMLSD
jgi:DNA-binding CsgD family transcriptional regulator